MSVRIGLWIVGACGGVATTTAVGLAALKRGLSDTTGLVTALPEFAGLDLVEWPDIILGGHEIRAADSLTAATELSKTSRIIDRELLIACEPDLQAFNENIRPGILFNVGPTVQRLADGAIQERSIGRTARKSVDLISADISAFRDENRLERVIVLNLASTEPPFDAADLPDDWTQLKPLLEKADCPLPASCLYSIAAFENGCPFINFTPSTGSDPAAIADLAKVKMTCYAGKDGKTGETFLKSVLAPAFARRNLEIMSWVGHNIFGNMDGQVLDDPANKQTKVKSKDQLLGQILGYQPQSHISIEYIQSLGDWKTAWDHIHFRGFLNTPMTMQFTWQGCDSILAAPLVLDLVRLTDLAARCGETGTLDFLASFFKSPVGTSENEFAKQFEMLQQWCSRRIVQS